MAFVGKKNTLISQENQEKNLKITKCNRPHVSVNYKEKGLVIFQINYTHTHTKYQDSDFCLICFSITW